MFQGTGLCTIPSQHLNRVEGLDVDRSRNENDDVGTITIWFAAVLQLSVLLHGQVASDLSQEFIFVLIIVSQFLYLHDSWYGENLTEHGIVLFSMTKHLHLGLIGPKDDVRCNLANLHYCCHI